MDTPIKIKARLKKQAFLRIRLLFGLQPGEDPLHDYSVDDGDIAVKVEVCRFQKFGVGFEPREHPLHNHSVADVDVAVEVEIAEGIGGLNLAAAAAVAAFVVIVAERGNGKVFKRDAAVGADAAAGGASLPLVRAASCASYEHWETGRVSIKTCLSSSQILSPKREFLPSRHQECPG